MRVRFERFDFDTERFTLTLDGDVVPMEPQVFDVLAYLILHRERLVPKEELLDEVWGDRFVSESALTSRIKAVRQAVGDDGRAQRMVQTTRGRGYRFIAPVTPLDGDATESSESAGTAPHPARRTNLPVSPSRMIGRDAALAEVRRALAEHRLVTLTAAGGTGKTRLALAVGEAELESRSGGVWFVDLTTVSNEELVPEAIARVVNLILAGGDPTNQVVDYLVNQDALLILDNCEHLVDACADFADSFLARAGTSRVLATTREFLDIDGERAIRLPPLAIGGESSAAVELFVERAVMADSTFQLHEQDRPIVSSLCRHLDGSPLAIELAAARSNVMSPSQLLDGLGERFELLSGGRRRRSKRALEDTLDWSYQLLDDEEQSLFRHLGIFVGSFDLDAVITTSGRSRSAALDLIDSLISKSLVVSERQGDIVRFRLLETTAAYAERALEESGELAAAAARHLDHYLAVCAPYDIGCWASVLPTSVLLDRDNIRAAVRYAGRMHRWADAGRLTFSASAALQTQPEDLMALTNDCLRHLSDADPATTLGLRWVVTYTGIQYDFAEPSVEAKRLELSSHPLESALGRMWRGFFAFHFDGPDACLATFEENAAALHALPDGPVKYQILAATQVITGWANAYVGRHQEALENQLEAQRHLLVYAPETSLMAEALASEGTAYVLLGGADAALAVADRLDQLRYLYFSGSEVRAASLIASGALDEALPHIREHAEDGVTGRLSRMANNSLLLLALLAEAEGDTAHARELLMSVEHARNPVISLSIELANRLDMSDAFNRAQAAGTPDQRASGRRAIHALAREMTRRGWSGTGHLSAP